MCFHYHYVTVSCRHGTEQATWTLCSLAYCEVYSGDEVSDIDALKIAKPLPDYAGEMKGIIPLFGGKCSAITIARPKAAANLAQEGIDDENLGKLLRLLNQ